MTVWRRWKAVVIVVAATAPAWALAAEAPLPGAEAARRMALPEGFSATLFAGEPDVRQPIAFTTDPRGRVWVAECDSYPDWLEQGPGRDRIVILEDTDGDGRSDRRRVFWDKGTNISGMALGFGGVWICAIPNLLFLPDRDGDDVPDGEPVVVLDGWHPRAKHNVFNGLTWGPDGWLYGCNGIFSESFVGAPGTPDDRRVALNCGVWRYHPTRTTFEAVAHGTTNPWGLDFDDYGEMFITNCVIPHLFRVVPGSHFQRMYGRDINPYSFGLLESCADHIHWAGGFWQNSRGGLGKHGEAGGGHAHAGAMVYLGDNWPDRYRNSVFTCNIHGRRVNRDRLARRGSGYVATHEKDFLQAADDWFRGLELEYGPDGAVYLSDWSDIGECHDDDAADGSHRENGRIYKISYGRPRPVRVDLARLDDEELVRLQVHKNDWYVRNARRLLQERAAAGRDMRRAHEALRALFESAEDVTRKLRAQWALHVTGGLDEPALLGQLDHPSEQVRAWAVRLLGDAGRPAPAAVARFATLAKDDPSPLVRLYLASALQRIPVADRWPIAEGLLAHSEDARDASIPLMTWYGVEPLVPADRARAVGLARLGAIPIVRQYLARRAILADDNASGARVGLDALVRLLGESDDHALRRDLLAGMLEALRGRRRVAMPEGWPAAAEALAKVDDPAMREQALMVALTFGDPKAVAALEAILLDPAAEVGARLRALQALAEHRVPGLAPHLQSLLDQPALRGPALRALAAYDDPETPRVVLQLYPGLSAAERDDAIATLAARPSYARALLDAIESGTIPRRDLSVTVARQLLAHGDRPLADRLAAVWGTLRPPSGAKAERMARYKARLTPDRLAAADPSRGRLVFDRTCAQCHRLYDAGGDVGPELTGSDRANLDYVLQNVLDPGAAVGRDYKLTTVATVDGRTLSGILREQSPTSLVLQTANDRVVLPREDVEEITTADASMMPEGLFDTLADDQVRDLIAYLASKSQVAPASVKGEDRN